MNMALRNEVTKVKFGFPMDGKQDCLFEAKRRDDNGRW